MINLACTAFVNCFVSATSINAAQIYSLSMNDLKNLESSAKGLRVVTTKPRAGYKSVEFTIPIKFKNILNEYLVFKKWIHKKFDYASNALEDSNLLFFGLNNTRARYGESFLISYSENQHNLYRAWFIQKFPEIDWIPLGKIRATIANIYHNESKSTLAVAKKLSNSPKIVASSYSEATENQVLSEMSDTFEEIAKAAPIISARAIPVKVDIHNIINTDMGHCTSRSPNLDPNYQDLELDEPNCSNAISCLFCENYVVHTDEEDIRKLLSAKKVFEMANSFQNAENIYIVIQKINDILDLIGNIYPDKKQQIAIISKDVNQGNLSLFFKVIMNTLSDLGVSFNA